MWVGRTWIGHRPLSELHLAHIALRNCFLKLARSLRAAGDILSSLFISDPELGIWDANTWSRYGFPSWTELLFWSQSSNLWCLFSKRPSFAVTPVWRDCLTTCTYCLQNLRKISCISKAGSHLNRRKQRFLCIKLSLWKPDFQKESSDMLEITFVFPGNSEHYKKIILIIEAKMQFSKVEASNQNITVLSVILMWWMPFLSKYVFHWCFPRTWTRRFAAE